MPPSMSNFESPSVAPVRADSCVQLVAVLAQVRPERLEQRRALVEGQLAQRRAADRAAVGERGRPCRRRRSRPGRPRSPVTASCTGAPSAGGSNHDPRRSCADGILDAPSHLLTDRSVIHASVPAWSERQQDPVAADDGRRRGLGAPWASRSSHHGPGTRRARMVVRDDMVNGHDIAHGGLVFALADTAFACACNSWGPVTVAAGAEIVFVAPARLGDVLRGRGRDAQPVRAHRHLRRHRAPRRRGGRRVPRPQPTGCAHAARRTRRRARRRGRPGLRPGVVLAAAVEVFNERGFDGTSMEDLARRLGIAKSAIYHHVAARTRCSGSRSTGRSPGWSRLPVDVRAADAPADRPARDCWCAAASRCCVAHLPYVTLLLRVRGNSERRTRTHWPAAGASTGSSPISSARPCPTATSVRTSTRRSPRACSSGWSTR